MYIPIPTILHACMQYCSLGKIKVTCVICTIVIVLFWMLQVVRLSMLATLIKQTLAVKDSPIDLTIKVLGQTSYCFEHFVLIYGLRKFYKLYECYQEKNELINLKSQLNFPKCYYAIFIIASLIHLFISMAPPTLLSAWEKQLVYPKTNSSNYPIAQTYVALAFFDHIYNFINRTVMLIITGLVINAWKESLKTLPNEQLSLDSDKLNIKGELCKLIKGYTETGQTVAALQEIFQGWFVIKWIVYFIDITGHSILAAKVLFKHTDVKEELIFVLAHLIYDFLVFFLLYFCGVMMNLYHTEYRKQHEQKQRKLLSRGETESLWVLQLMNVIPENPEYNFIPSVFHIDFPLNSPGYTLTMLLTLFAFVANFLTQFD